MSPSPCRLTDAEVTPRLLNADQPTQNLLAVAAARSSPVAIAPRQDLGRAAAGAGDPWRADDRRRRRHPPTPSVCSTGVSAARSIATPAERQRSTRCPVTASTTGCCATCARHRRAAGAHPEPQLLLNFLGRIHYGVGGEVCNWTARCCPGVPALPEPDLAMRYELTINWRRSSPRATTPVLARSGAPCPTS